MSQAQDTATDSTLVYIKLVNSGQISGKIISEDEQNIRIQKVSGEIILIPKYAIKKITNDINELEQTIPFSHEYYFIGQSAYPYKLGNAEYKTIFGVTHQFNFAILNNFSGGIGAAILPVIRPAFIELKYSKKINENIVIALQGKYVSKIGRLTENNFRGSHTNLLVTFGSPQKNVTITAGLLRYYYTDSRSRTIYNPVTNQIAYENYVYKDLGNSANFALSANKDLNTYASLMLEIWGAPRVGGTSQSIVGGILGMKLATKKGFFDAGFSLFNQYEKTKLSASNILPFIGYNYRFDY